MAEELLVRQILSRELIVAGKDIIKNLDKAGLKITAALWNYLPETQTWRLLIASPQVGEVGPKKVYQKIRSVLKKTPSAEGCITLSDISVVEHDNPIISLLSGRLKTREFTSGVTVSSPLGFIDNAIVYRST